ncbi:MAG TPA: hypothetical protein VFY28_00190 [Candidatus Paceibacterota bacterium]|nr:hypothetical protein [Candidatus Paceibacterota bacterium]
MHPQLVFLRRWAEFWGTASQFALAVSIIVGLGCLAAAVWESGGFAPSVLYLGIAAYALTGVLFLGIALLIFVVLQLIPNAGRSEEFAKQTSDTLREGIRHWQGIAYRWNPVCAPFVAAWRAIHRPVTGFLLGAFIGYLLLPLLPLFHALLVIVLGVIGGAVGNMLQEHREGKLAASSPSSV